MRKRDSFRETRARDVTNSAGEIKKYSRRKKVLIAILPLLVLILLGTYLVSMMYKETGSFTVTVDKFDMTRYGLTLAEDRAMTYKTASLSARISESLTNIYGGEIPADVDMQDGEHNGTNYIAYTFYLQNAGEVSVAYEYSIKMLNITNNLDSAIRIRVYKDGEPETFAKTKGDGSGPEKGTTEFHSSELAMLRRVDLFNPGDVHKYTVVIWIEGTDADCQDWLVGGQLMLGMIFSVVH